MTERAAQALSQLNYIPSRKAVFFMLCLPHMTSGPSDSEQLTLFLSVLPLKTQFNNQLNLRLGPHSLTGLNPLSPLTQYPGNSKEGEKGGQSQ